MMDTFKKSNGDHENQFLDYLIKVTTAKISSLTVSVEDIILK